MYSASSAFHQAVKNGNPQKPLLIFSNRYFTDYDIDVTAGIEFNEYFNTEDDISIGQTLSNEISFTLINEDRSLNDFAFGQFKALLGVRTATQQYGPPPVSVTGYVSIGHGYFYQAVSKTMLAFEGGRRDTYEFVPLGTFIAERPDAPDKISVDITCYDLMQKFEKDMEEVNVSYPTTVGQLLQTLCTVAGVETNISTFINSGVEIKRKPSAFDNATMRDVLRWIAEVAGSNARFNRDGYLVLDWLRSTNQSFSETDYMTFDPYWYTTERVGQLYNRTTNNGIDFHFGSGVGYLIQDNPFLTSLNESLKDESIREKRQASLEKETRKLQYCILVDEETGYEEVDYEKQLWMTDNEETWPDQSAEWNSAHPDRHYKEIDDGE